MSQTLLALKTSLRIFLRAQAAYAIITIPCLIFPIIWLISEALALMWGAASLLLFLPVLPIIRAAGLRIKLVIVCLVLIAGLTATFIAVWKACATMEENTLPLDSMLEWWPFPVVAFVSVIYGVLREHKALEAKSADYSIPAGHRANTPATSSYYPPV